MTTRETWEAVTVVSAHIVDAFAAICAGFGQAFVQIELAILTLEARRTMAYVGTVIIIAYTVVQARVRLTLIDVHVAIDAFVAKEKKWRTFAIYKKKSMNLCNTPTLP